MTEASHLSSLSNQNKLSNPPAEKEDFDGLDILPQATSEVVSTPTMSEDEAADALLKVEKNLDAYRAGVHAANSTLLTTEREVDKGLMYQARYNMSMINDDGNRFTKFSEKDANVVMFWCPIAMAVLGALVPGLLGFGVVPMAGFGILGLLAGILSGSELGPKGLHPYPYMRNKVILRKAYKREVRRISGKNQSTEKHYEQLRNARAKKLEKAEKIVKQLASQHEINNPGKSLAISSDKRSVVEIDLKQTSPTNVFASKIVNGVKPQQP